jgi:hypothetical protein
MYRFVIHAAPNGFLNAYTAANDNNFRNSITAIDIYIMLDSGYPDLSTEFQTSLNYISSGAYKLDFESLMTRAPGMKRLNVLCSNRSPSGTLEAQRSAEDAWCQLVTDNLAVLTTLEHVRLKCLSVGDRWIGSMITPPKVLYGMPKDSTVFEELEELYLHQFMNDSKTPPTSLLEGSTAKSPEHKASTSSEFFFNQSTKLKVFAYNGNTWTDRMPSLGAINVPPTHVLPLTTLDLFYLSLDRKMMLDMLSRFAATLTSLKLAYVHLCSDDDVWTPVFDLMVQEMHLRHVTLREIGVGEYCGVIFDRILRKRPFVLGPEFNSEHDPGVIELCWNIDGVDLYGYHEIRDAIAEELDDGFVFVFQDNFAPQRISLDEDAGDDVKAWMTLVRDRHENV